MRPFQLIVGPVLVLLAARELLKIRESGLRVVRLLRFIVWSIAAVLVFWPDLTVPAARLFGIERGVDLVVYCFLLGSTTISLYLYARQDRLERKLVQLARERALEDARRGELDE